MTGRTRDFLAAVLPYIYNYNLNIERQMSGDMVIKAGYVGSRGRHLVYVRDENPVLPNGIVNGRLFWSRTGGPRILIGPSLFTLDFSIGKQFPLQFIREDAKLEFRAEAFNVTNHVNYANPDPRQSFFAGASPNDPVVASGTFSPRTKTPSRQLQFGLRLSF